MTQTSVIRAPLVAARGGRAAPRRWRRSPARPAGVNGIRASAIAAAERGGHAPGAPAAARPRPAGRGRRRERARRARAPPGRRSGRRRRRRSRSRRPSTDRTAAVAPSMNAGSKRPPPRLAAAHEKSIIAWPDRRPPQRCRRERGGERDAHRQVAQVEQEAGGDRRHGAAARRRARRWPRTAPSPRRRAPTSRSAPRCPSPARRGRRTRSRAAARRPRRGSRSAGPSAGARGDRFSCSRSQPRHRHHRLCDRWKTRPTRPAIVAGRDGGSYASFLCR